MKYCFLRFPGGKMKALTLSYDDGVREDIRLAQTLDQYGIKGTFNINSSTVDNGRNLTTEEIQTCILDRGHEVAVHGERHMAPGIGFPPLALADALNCRLSLEKRFGRIIRGMAYPDSGVTKMHNGNDYQTVRSNLQSCGIVYARTLGGDNHDFMLPTDWYAWMPTAHHNNPNLWEWVEEFLALEDENIYLTRRYPRLFYLWGHSFEFKNNQNWDRLERFCETVSGKDDIWYATNIEIYEYVQAYQSLIRSADGNRIYNPTLREIWFMADGKNYHMNPGEELWIEEV